MNHAKGLWQASFVVGRSPTGKALRRQVYATTKTAAQEKLESLKAEIHDGTISAPSKMTVAEYLKLWLADTIRPNLTFGAYRDYESTMRNHVIPIIGGYRLRHLEPTHVQHLTAELERRGKSARCREKVHVILSGALKQAVAWRLMTANPCKAVKAPKVERKEMRFLDEVQAATLLDAALSDRLHALYVLAVTTGMRQGELLGLKWTDLNLKATKASVTIMRTLDPSRCPVVAKDTKTPWSRRTIQLASLAVVALRDHQKRMLTEGNRASEWVFCNTEGNPYYRANLVRRSFEPLLKKAGVPRIRFHDLRHTAASLMLARGVNIKIVSQILGHKDVKITLDRYGHILPSMQEQAVAAMDSLFGASITSR